MKNSRGKGSNHGGHDIGCSAAGTPQPRPTSASRPRISVCPLDASVGVAAILWDRLPVPSAQRCGNLRAWSSVADPARTLFGVRGALGEREGACADLLPDADYQGDEAVQHALSQRQDVPTLQGMLCEVAQDTQPIKPQFVLCRASFHCPGSYIPPQILHLLPLYSHSSSLTSCSSATSYRLFRPQPPCNRRLLRRLTKFTCAV